MTEIDKLLQEPAFEAWKRENYEKVRRGNAIAAFLGDTDKEELDKSLWDMYEQQKKDK